MTDEEMTNREIAYQLGARLIEANLRVLSMTNEMDALKSQGYTAAWRNSAAAAYTNVHLPVAKEQIADLRIAIDASSSEDLLHTLQTFLKETLRPYQPPL